MEERLYIRVERIQPIRWIVVFNITQAVWDIVFLTYILIWLIYSVYKSKIFSRFQEPMIIETIGMRPKLAS